MSRLVLPDFALETYFSKWEFSAEWHLTASDAESMTVSDLLALDEDPPDLDDVHLGYTPTWGTAPLRAAIAGLYEGVDMEDTLAFAGAGEPLFWAMQLFAEPGDHVIVNVPNYQSIESVPVATGVDVEGLPLWSDTGGRRTWTLDLDRFEAMVRPETSLVSVNFPNNPTGFVPDEQTWRSFLELCDARGVRVVSDEVYRGVELDPVGVALDGAHPVTPCLQLRHQPRDERGLARSGGGGEGEDARAVRHLSHRPRRVSPESGAD